MKITSLLCIVLFFIACNDAPQAQSQDSLNSAPAQKPAANTTASANDVSGKSPEALDSVVRGYALADYQVVDTFSKGNKERIFATKKNFVRTSFQFNTEKIFYNTGVKSASFTAIVAGFNTGVYTPNDAPMDGIVVRVVEKNGYWFVQANVASGYIDERMTVDVLFIRSDQIENVK
jgi:hypothetical protein